MRKVKIYRANFSTDSGLFLPDYCRYVLSKKYDVEISDDNPDIVFFSNLFTPTESIDAYTGKKCALAGHFPNSKKVFLSGEFVSDYSYYGTLPDYYSIGSPSNFYNDKILKMQFYTVASSWVLHEKCGFFKDHLSWLTEKREFNEKKYFCSIMQSSQNAYRKELFDKLCNFEFVRACGGFKTNVSSEECPLFTHNEYKDIKNKIIFLSNNYFSIQVQSTNAPWFTQEKIIHAYAANTIPIFYGNNKILDDGYNPDSFINCHNYNSVDEVVEAVKEIYNDKAKLKRMLEEPIFTDNKVPDYFYPEYLLAFLDKLLV